MPTDELGRWFPLQTEPSLEPPDDKPIDPDEGMLVHHDGMWLKVFEVIPSDDLDPDKTLYVCLDDQDAEHWLKREDITEVSIA